MNSVVFTPLHKVRIYKEYHSAVFGSYLSLISLLLTNTVSRVHIHMIGEFSLEPKRRRAWAS
jgi:hypothetical protein